MEKLRATCPVCGYTKLEQRPYQRMPEISEALYLAKPPYEKLWGPASYEVCDCCGFEFGFDDNAGLEAEKNSSFQSHLLEWVAESKASWFEPSKQPTEWDLREQLQSAAIPIPNELSTLLKRR